MGFDTQAVLFRDGSTENVVSDKAFDANLRQVQKHYSFDFDGDHYPDLFCTTNKCVLFDQKYKIQADKVVGRINRDFGTYQKPRTLEVKKDDQLQAQANNEFNVGEKSGLEQFAEFKKALLAGKVLVEELTFDLPTEKRKTLCYTDSTGKKYEVELIKVDANGIVTDDVSPNVHVVHIGIRSATQHRPEYIYRTKTALTPIQDKLDSLYIAQMKASFGR